MPRTRRNPYMGSHPDLLSVAHRYPAGVETPIELVTGEVLPPGHTPLFVPLDQIPRDELVKLPRRAFSKEEWGELDDESREEIYENDAESESRIHSLVAAFVTPYKWASSPSGDFSEIEIPFEEFLRERARDESLWEIMDADDYGDLVEKWEAQGIPEERVREIVNEEIADHSHWSFGVSDDGGCWTVHVYDRYSGGSVREVTSSFSIQYDGYVSLERHQYDYELKECFPDEVERAVESINDETDHFYEGMSRTSLADDLNHDRLVLIEMEGLRGDARDKLHRTLRHPYGFEGTVETGYYLHAGIKALDWEQIVANVDEKLGELEPILEIPGALPPEERVVHKWPDGFYVQDLIPMELPAEGKAMGMCVGRADMGYGRAVRDGEIKILSLRRPSGKPLFTLEATLDGDGDIVAFEQVKGKSNRLPGFDLGKAPASMDVARLERAAGEMKRDEVKRVLEYLATTDVRIGGIDDMVPALNTIKWLYDSDDKWALDVVDRVLEGDPYTTAIITRRRNPANACGAHGEACTGFCSPYRARRRNW